MTPDLSEIHDMLWRGLVRAAADRRHDWRTPVLATAGADGAPRARTVVLRATDPAARRLRLHTDRRSGKAQEIAAQPRVALVFWDRRARVQLRVDGLARLVTDGAAHAEAWAATPAPARRDYATRDPPGAAVAGPAVPRDGDASRHFALVVVGVLAVDWLSLARDAHRRARFTWNGGEPRATWLVP